MAHEHDKNKFVATCAACIIASHYKYIGKRAAASNKKNKPKEYWLDLSRAGVEARRRKAQNQG